MEKSPAARRAVLFQILCLLWWGGSPVGLSAQYDEVPPPAAYALPGVTVHGADGTVREGVTVVIRDRFVERIAADDALPADAEVLETEGLHVYPGLVDARGGASFQLPAPPTRDEATPWDPSREAQGFTPERPVVDHLTDVGEDFEPRRREGVVASGVFPDQGFAAGLGAVLVHRPEAASTRELVADPEAGLALSFSPSSTSYPSTIFGILAYLRQAFLDAEHLSVRTAEYRQDPAGLTLPEWDPAAEVMSRAAGGGLPVFFRADGVEDVRRVLDLAEEIGFSPVIVGGGGAWRLADRLAEGDIPVLVSLDFPEPTEWDPETQGDVPAEELEPEEAREREELTDLYANAARLEEAGVRIALTSGGGEARLRDGARTVIEHGLPEEAVLRAVTTTPAELLGIGAVPRLDPGLAANLVVTDGPLFGEGSAVRYTFVEGVPERFEEPGPGQDGENDAAEEDADGPDGGADPGGRP